MTLYNVMDILCLSIVFFEKAMRHDYPLFVAASNCISNPGNEATQSRCRPKRVITGPSNLLVLPKPLSVFLGSLSTGQHSR